MVAIDDIVHVLTSLVNATNQEERSVERRRSQPGSSKKEKMRRAQAKKDQLLVGAHQSALRRQEEEFAQLEGAEAKVAWLRKELGRKGVGEGKLVPEIGVNRSGTVGPGGFQRGLEAVGVHIAAAGYKELFSAVDADSSGRVDRDEILR